MLSNKEIGDIRTHLEDSLNPLFFFDNDQDGLCSYLLLRRFLGEGKGVPVKNSNLDKDYLRRVKEFNPDKIFILDVPIVSKEFLEAIRDFNLPIIWVDHHKIENLEIPDFVEYFNSYSDEKKFGEPVTDLCFKVSGKEEDIWLAIIGCISDKYMPEYYDKFFKKYPELGIKSEDAFEVFYNSEIGKIAQILGSGLKDRTTNVMRMLRYLIDLKIPNEILQDREMEFLIKRHSDLNSKVEKIIDKAEVGFKDNSNLVYVKYSGETSMSSSVSNKLSFLYPDKIVLVSYFKGDSVTLSMRGEKVKDIFLLAIEGLENVRGGGHENAVGGKFDKNSFGIFLKRVQKIMNKEQF